MRFTLAAIASLVAFAAATPILTGPLNIVDDLVDGLEEVAEDLNEEFEFDKRAAAAKPFTCPVLANGGVQVAQCCKVSRGNAGFECTIRKSGSALVDSTGSPNLLVKGRELSYNVEVVYVFVGIALTLCFSQGHYQGLCAGG